MAKILIAEDEWLIAKDLEIVLENLGHEIVAVCPSGEDTIEKVYDLNPDIIFMDIQLSGLIDGIEVARRIRLQYDLPIIYCTANSDYCTLEKMITTKPDGLVVKPFNKKDIEKILTKIELNSIPRNTNQNKYQTNLKLSPAL